MIDPGYRTRLLTELSELEDAARRLRVAIDRDDRKELYIALGNAYGNCRRMDDVIDDMLEEENP